MACEPEDVMAGAQSLCCIPPNLHAAVQSYLLARIRGGSMDVNEIVREAACEISCIPPGLLPSIRTYLLCQLSNTGGGEIPEPPACTHPLVDDPVTGWTQRVLNNGGAAVSETTRGAMCDFCNGLDGAGLTAKMKGVNCFAPDNLIAAITPLIVGTGNDPWTNSGPFVAGDLTADGLKGNGAKYLRTGVIPSTNLSLTSGGLTIYNTHPTNEASRDFAAVVAATGPFELFVSNGGVSYFDCWNGTVGQGRASAANALWTGFLSGNRTAANSSVIYRARTTTPFASIASINTTGGSRPVNDMWLFAQNSAGVPLGITTRRYSFAAIHEGLNATECEDLFDLVQQLRVRLGGGWV